VAAPCVDTGAKAFPDTTYRLVIVPVDSDEARRKSRECDPGRTPSLWLDGCQRSTPTGWAALEGGPGPGWGASLGTLGRHAFSKFFRRVISAPLMTPIVELRSPSTSRVHRALFGERVFLLRPRMERVLVDGVETWRGTFRTPADQPHLYDGEGGHDGNAHVYMFLNDAVLPLDPGGQALDCHPTWRLLGVDLFNMCGRYANNTGRYQVSVERVEVKSTESVVDERVRKHEAELHGQAAKPKA
jgi:hypothetical protein